MYTAVDNLSRMRIVSAEINQVGIDAVLSYATKPSDMRLDEDRDDLDFSQTYIPGITVPSHTGLREPFNVPIQGDNEPVGLSIYWNRKGFQDVIKQIDYIGMLTAEEITIGEPIELDWLEGETDEDQQRIDEAFDDFTEWGGFLHVHVEVVEVGNDIEGYSPINKANARFILFDTEDNFQLISEAIDNKLINNFDILSALKMGVDLRQISASSD